MLWDAADGLLALLAAILIYSGLGFICCMILILAITYIAACVACDDWKSTLPITS